MSDKSYNGWTNVETWGVVVEFLDDVSIEYFSSSALGCESMLAVELRELVYSQYSEYLTGVESFMRNKLLSLVEYEHREVDWEELARSLLVDWAELQGEAS